MNTAISNTILVVLAGSLAVPPTAPLSTVAKQQDLGSLPKVAVNPPSHLSNIPKCYMAENFVYRNGRSVILDADGQQVPNSGSPQVTPIMLDAQGQQVQSGSPEVVLVMPTQNTPKPH